MLNKDIIYNALTDEYKVSSSICSMLGINQNTVRDALNKMVKEGLVERKKIPVSFICGTNKRRVMTFAFRLKQL